MRYNQSIVILVDSVYHNREPRHLKTIKTYKEYTILLKVIIYFAPDRLC